MHSQSTARTTHVRSLRRSTGCAQRSFMQSPYDSRRSWPPLPGVMSTSDLDMVDCRGVEQVGISCGTPNAQQLGLC